MHRSLWHVDADHSELRKMESNAVDDHRIQALYSMISMGTERLVALGQVPPSLYAQMAVNYMQGDFSFPIKYGYSLVGKWMDTEEESLVHLMHPHQDFLSASANDCFGFDKSIPAARACLASNVETCVNAIWDARLDEGMGQAAKSDSTQALVAVLGFGSIGALLAETLRQYVGLHAFVVELNEEKKKIAQDAGFEVSKELGTEKFDIVFNTTSNEQALTVGLNALKPEGKLIEMSWYGIKKVSLPLGGAFHVNRLQLISSQVSRIPSHKKEFDFLKRKELVFSLLGNSSYDQYITKVISLEEAPVFFNALRKGEHENEIVCLIKYN